MEVRKELRALGFEVVAVAPPASRGPISRLLGIVVTLVSACWQLRTVDAAYVRHHPLGAPISLVAAACDVHRVEEVNGEVTDFAAVHRWLRPLLGLLSACSAYQLRTADHVIVVSRVMAEAIHRQVGVKPTIMPNGADLSIFRPAPAEGRDDRPEYALFFGALTTWQGLDVLIRAVRSPAWPDDLDLLVVGDGPLTRMIRSDAPPSVRLLGPLPQVELAELLRRARVTLSPKRTEAEMASPLKVIESIASGVPVVVTDLGQQRDLVRDHGVGLAVPVDDPEALAAAVRTLARDDERHAQCVAACLELRPELGWDRNRSTLAQVMRVDSA